MFLQHTNLQISPKLNHVIIYAGFHGCMSKSKRSQDMRWLAGSSSSLCLIQNVHDIDSILLVDVPSQCGFIHLLTADVLRPPSPCQISFKWLLFRQTPVAPPWRWPSQVQCLIKRPLILSFVLTPRSNFHRFHHNISKFHTLLTLILVVLNRLSLCLLFPHHPQKSHDSQKEGVINNFTVLIRMIEKQIKSCTCFNHIFLHGELKTLYEEMAEAQNKALGLTVYLHHDLWPEPLVGDRKNEVADKRWGAQWCAMTSVQSHFSSNLTGASWGGTAGEGCPLCPSLWACTQHIPTGRKPSGGGPGTHCRAYNSQQAWEYLGPCCPGTVQIKDVYFVGCWTLWDWIYNQTTKSFAIRWLSIEALIHMN